MPYWPSDNAFKRCVYIKSSSNLQHKKLPRYKWRVRCSVALLPSGEKKFVLRFYFKIFSASFRRGFEMKLKDGSSLASGDVLSILGAGCSVSIKLLMFLSIVLKHY